MNLFIDGEWNGFGGELISMALVSDRDHFYEVLGCKNPHPWVAEHVMPTLGKKPISIKRFQRLLGEYLNQFDCIHVIADWPEDISYFCNALITGPGERLSTPPMTMEVRRDIGNDNAEVIHNALSDAKAIRESYLKITEA